MVALGKLHSTGHRLNFIDLWKSTNGPNSWDANPWVWVISFKRLDSAKLQGIISDAERAR
jgi:hypothetical protein